MRDRARRAGARRRRRRVRLPRRPRPAGARLDAAARPGVGSTGSRRSRAGCGGATCATTRASWRASRASTRGTARLRAAPRSLPRRMRYDVSVIGLGRVGLPLALSFADRGLRVLGVDNDPERLGAVRERPDAVQGARHRRAARPRRAALDARPTAPPTPRRPTHIVLTLGTPAFSHIEIDMRDIRSVLDDLLPLLRDGPRARAALDGRARHDRVRRRLPREAPRLRDRRGRVRRARARADRRRPLPRGDRDAAVHRRRRRRGARASARRELFERASARRSCRPRRCRPSWRRSGPTSCATRRSRCPTC